MKWHHYAACAVCSLFAGCSHVSERGTIAELDDVTVKVEDVTVDNGLDKAMQSYQAFLEETPESVLTPDAIRRIADLKIEKEYGVIGDDRILEREGSGKEELDRPRKSFRAAPVATGEVEHESGNQTAPGAETDSEFEKRTTLAQSGEPRAEGFGAAVPPGEAGSDLDNANASEAIAMYTRLLEKYPMYERNDQVLYQLSRAYEEIGQVEQSMSTIDRLIEQSPDSRYIDEVQFRRGEYFFVRKKYIDAEEAYGAILRFGVSSIYYERALYKQGWAFYKQELYEEALQRFMALLDYKISVGYDLAQTENKIESKRVEDTFRVISLSFSNLGGAEAVDGFFDGNGPRSYENLVYQNLAEFYLTKRRYSDATATYDAFVKQNPFHRDSPRFSMRVIDIYGKGGFPRLVVEAKKKYASTYGVNAEYWNHFNRDEEPEVMGYLKTNLVDLANHYHALYQDKRFVKERTGNFGEASRWYREFLASFPKDEQSPGINYQLAELLLENDDYRLAAIEYERTAYEYDVNEKSHEAAYAAVYAYRENLKHVSQPEQLAAKQEIVRSSLRLIDVFPEHEKATIVLASAVDDLFSMQNYQLAVNNGRRLVDEYPEAAPDLRRGAWLVIAHSSFELANYADGEAGYLEVLKLTAADAKERPDVVDNLAASIYKQGEQARSREDYRQAVDHFLRIAKLAPTSKIRPAAEYDAAVVLIQTMELERAAAVLLAIRQNFPGHELQHEVTKKIAYVLREDGKAVQAANEYERIETESQDDEVRREALITAAELYEQSSRMDDALRVYRKYVEYFPEPVEYALETQYKIAMVYKARSELADYRTTLQHIIDTDAAAGRNRTDRTRYLAAQSSLVIIEPRFDDYVALRLEKPFEESLRKKNRAMKSLVESYGSLVDYGVAEVTSASTFYIAEIYDNFNRSLLESERPDGLSPMELEQYNLALEDQAYPFEEKTISVHEKNVELIRKGIYNKWIERSIEKLATLMPARYAKNEESSGYITDMRKFSYVSQTGTNPLQEGEIAADNYDQQGVKDAVAADGQGADGDPGHSPGSAADTPGIVQEQHDDATTGTVEAAAIAAGETGQDTGGMQAGTEEPGEAADSVNPDAGQEDAVPGGNDGPDIVTGSADNGRAMTGSEDAAPDIPAGALTAGTADSAPEQGSDAGEIGVAPARDDGTDAVAVPVDAENTGAVVAATPAETTADMPPGEPEGSARNEVAETGSDPVQDKANAGTDANDVSAAEHGDDTGSGEPDSSAGTGMEVTDPAAADADGDEDQLSPGAPSSIEVAGGV